MTQCDPPLKNPGYAHVMLISSFFTFYSKSVAKEISKPPFLAPVGIKVYCACLIHISLFRTMPIFGMSRDHNRKRLKTRTAWIVFET